MLSLPESIWITRITSSLSPPPRTYIDVRDGNAMHTGRTDGPMASIEVAMATTQSAAQMAAMATAKDDPPLDPTVARSLKGDSSTSGEPRGNGIVKDSTTFVYYCLDVRP